MNPTFRALFPLAAAFVCIASPAHATEDAPPTTIVSHRDLDLTDANDVKILEGRVRRSVRSVCPKPTLSLRESMIARKCQKAAAANAAAQTEVAIASAQTRMRLASGKDNRAIGTQ